MHTVELLAPARDLECGIAAIESGADAVYIGGPGFGARADAGNSLEDIRKLCLFAHTFRAKVHVALNTILTDEELIEARKLAFALYDVGVDALIIQDYGLIAGELPPLEIHASTQQDNATLEKVQFLEKAGFNQVVLARELSLQEIKHISAHTSVKLEAFVHGALCVGISGRCYLSQALTGRSANRGECAQLCRVKQNLRRSDGSPLALGQYLLSMKDLSQSKNLKELIQAGVSSFKIEGRLKDPCYVRNVTAFYRRLLDEIISEDPNLERTSFGFTVTSFEPDIQKSFNRGFTEYNTHGKKANYANFKAPGFVGQRIGILSAQKGRILSFKLDPKISLHNGDSLNYFDSHEELHGFRASSTDGSSAEIFQEIPKISIGTIFYRNKDAEFEKNLAGHSSERKLKLNLKYQETENGALLFVKDETGFSGQASVTLDKKEAAKDPARLEANISEKLGRLGDTPFTLESFEKELPYHWFMPQSFLNSLRRNALLDLENNKLAVRPNIKHDFKNAPLLPEADRNLGFRANLLNQEAKNFYRSHGVTNVVAAYEAEKPKEPQKILVSKHCLRYCFHLCPVRDRVPDEPLYLEIGKGFFRVDCDHKNCRMELVGPLPKSDVPYLNTAKNSF